VKTGNLHMISLLEEIYTWLMLNGASSTNTYFVPKYLWEENTQAQQPLQHCTTVPLYHCTTALLYHCTTVPLYHCITAHLYHCTTVPLHHCTTAPLHHCTTAPLFHYTTVPLHHCTTVPHHHCTTSPLYHFTTVPLHHCTTHPPNVVRCMKMLTYCPISHLVVLVEILYPMIRVAVLSLSSANFLFLQAVFCLVVSSLADCHSFDSRLMSALQVSAR
jgi:hypothetical protein